MEGMFNNEMQSTPNAQSKNTVNPLSPKSAVMPVNRAGQSGYTPHEAAMGRVTEQWANPLTPAKFDNQAYAGYESFQPDKDLGGISQRADGTFVSTGTGGGGGINENVTGQEDYLNQWMADVDRDYANWQKGEDTHQAKIQADLDAYHAGLGQEDPSQITRPGDPRGGAGGRTGGTVYQGPVYDYPEYNIGEFEYGATLDLPDYEPPEYDEGKERAIREEFIQTSKGALSEQVQQAILGSASINNPQARGQIIRAALEGFGDALGGVALKGSQEGRRGAEAQWGRDAKVYNTQYDIRAKEEVARYDQELNEDLMNWELEVTGANRDYQQQLSNWKSMPVDIQAQQMRGRV